MIGSISHIFSLLFITLVGLSDILILLEKRDKNVFTDPKTLPGTDKTIEQES
jgi:hypothetical protein